MKMHTQRARVESIVDIAESIYDRWSAGADIDDAFKQELVDQTVARYSVHIAAALRRSGFAIADGEVVDAEVLMRCINERTGMDLQVLSVEGVTEAVNGLLSKSISEMLGVQIDSVTDSGALKQQLIDAAVESVQSGRPSKLMPKAMIKKIQIARAWAVAGVQVSDRRRTLARYYQKKYRRKHIAKWI